MPKRAKKFGRMAGEDRFTTSESERLVRLPLYYGLKLKEIEQIANEIFEFYQYVKSEVKMKGIILAGGTGSRLFPLTKVTNKHLLPVGKYPMIFHSIAKLKEADITDILIVTGKDHMGDVVNLLGSGMSLAFPLPIKCRMKQVELHKHLV